MARLRSDDATSSPPAQSDSRAVLQLHLMVHECERRRIAAELHDELGQQLTLFKMQLSEAERCVRNGTQDKAADCLERIKNKVDEMQCELHRITMNLRPLMLDELGLLPTLSWYFREFSRVCQRIELTSEIDVQETDVPEALRIEIFRLVQEALNNVVKHAEATHVVVRLQAVSGDLQLRIFDDGRGFESAESGVRADGEGGFGLIGMRERAASSGGEYRIESAPGRGTKICVRWPRRVLTRRSALPRRQYQQPRLVPALAATGPAEGL